MSSPLHKEKSASLTVPISSRNIIINSLVIPKSGERLWMEPLMRNVSASPTLESDRLLTFTEEGGGFVHEVSPEGARLLAKNKFGQPIFAPTIVFEDSLIARSASMLRRFSSKGR